MDRATTRPGRDTLPPETRLLLIERSLEEGAKKFTLLEASLVEAQKAAAPKPVRLWPFVTFGFILLNAGGAWLWHAAQYPGRDEFERSRAVDEDRYERSRQDLESAKRSLLELSLKREEEDKRAARLESELDALRLLGRRKP